MRRCIWNVANIPAITATIVVLAAAMIAEDINRDIHLQQARSDLLHRANLIGSKMQGLVTANVELVRGLSSTIATEPQIDQRRFRRLASSLFHENTMLRNIAGAPDLVVSLMYPMKGNEKAIGLDYRKNEAQRSAALQARDSGETTLAGPVNLVQGGQGFIARYPIFHTHPVHGMEFWGLLSSVISTEKVYEASGIFDQKDVEFVLVGQDGKGASGAQFFGSSHVNDNDPVKVTIDFGIGSWELRAVPKGGWHVMPSNVWVIRGIALIVFMLVVVPFIFVGWLSRARLAHLKANIQGQKKLARITKRLEMALQTSLIGVWEHDPASGTTTWDNRMNDLYGFEKDHLITVEEWKTRLHPEDRERVISEANTAIETEGMYRSEFRIVMPSGREKTIRAVGSLLCDDRGEKRLIGVNWDISDDVERQRALHQARAESERRYQELELAKERIEANALHDFLTGLPNRRYLDDQLNRRDGDGHRLEDSISLIKIDLDGFKEVNDNFGHAAGDAMLVKVADLLRANIQNGEFAARVGGDEFVVVCETTKDKNRPEEIAEKIVEEIQKPINYDGRTCRLGASIGIASGADAKGNVDKLLSNADLALYQSKQNGKSQFNFFSEPLYQSARKQRKLADDLLRGIENKEFIAFYQGQYCAKSHALSGAEALARWQHPERGLLAPFEFLDLAESLGVTSAIDAMILDQAIAAKEHWKQKHLTVPRVSVNVSAKRLGDKELMSNLEKLDFDPKGLTFELVESTFLDRSDAQVAANIKQIREMGIDIEIDDFGTAYASIVSLTHLLPNRLKIDRQLITPVIDSADQRELVHSIIHIGRTLGIGTVAEGVESMKHADILRMMGVDLLQGYAFSKPTSRDEFLRHHLERKSVKAA